MKYNDSWKIFCWFCSLIQWYFIRNLIPELERTLPYVNCGILWKCCWWNYNYQWWSMLSGDNRILRPEIINIKEGFRLQQDGPHLTMRMTYVFDWLGQKCQDDWFPGTMMSIGHQNLVIWHRWIIFQFPLIRMRDQGDHS